ncbi:RidA family protein [Caproiciproducens sp. LBM24188]|nr:RidA family protein [Oscillospiraceae bacterium]HHV31268.1 RidA family protein [Clostridiales bacterium]
MKTVINTEKAPSAIGPYSQGVIVNGIFYTSGQIPINPETGEVPDGIQAQTTQIIKNLAALLQEAGSSFENVIKTTCFIANMDDFSAFNEIYGKYFISKPARSCVAVKTLPKNVLAEIELVATVD